MCFERLNSRLIHAVIQTQDGEFYYLDQMRCVLKPPRHERHTIVQQSVSGEGFLNFLLRNAERLPSEVFAAGVSGVALRV